MGILDFLLNWCPWILAVDDVRFVCDVSLDEIFTAWQFSMCFHPVSFIIVVFGDWFWLWLYLAQLFRRWKWTDGWSSTGHAKWWPSQSLSESTPWACYRGWWPKWPNRLTRRFRLRQSFRQRKLWQGTKPVFNIWPACVSIHCCIKQIIILNEFTPKLI